MTRFSARVAMMAAMMMGLGQSANLAKLEANWSPAPRWRDATSPRRRQRHYRDPNGKLATKAALGTLTCCHGRPVPCKQYRHGKLYKQPMR